MRRITIALLLSALSLHAPPLHSQSATKPASQPTLQQRVAAIARDSDSTVAVACALPNQPLDCDVNPDNHPPMQSVFKLPLAVTILHQVEQGRFTLDQPIRFLPSDRILPSTYSPLQDAHPAANIDVPLRELLRLSASLSDNAATDILLRIAGGPPAVQTFIASLGIKDFHLVDGEQGLYADAHAQFDNWFSPRAAVQFLRLLADQSPVNPADTQFLFHILEQSTTTPNRIRAGLPKGTVLRHKSGTSQTVLGLTYATNDVALIVLPDGRTLALAVFLTNSTDDEPTREATIASIAKAAYEAALATHP